MQRVAQQDSQKALNEDSNARVGAVVVQQVAKQARLTATPLPKIPYDKKRLDSLIKKVPLAPNNQIIVDDYLKNIENRISDIDSWQEDEYMEDLYEAMQLALVEIHNTTGALCSLIAKYDTLGSFANRLKTILEELTAPLSKELEKRLVPKDEKAALELKTKRLYAAQSFIETSQIFQNALRQQLERVKTLLEQRGKPTPRCYISYAWPSAENKEQEYWVQPFLYILCEHLRSAGINIIMDVRDNKPGDSIFGFMDQYNDGNYIILIGTPSLLEKHKSYKNHAVKIELNIINNRFEKDHKPHGKSHIYPLLISGTIQTSYPEMYDKYRTVKDCRDNDYLSLIEHLTQWLYGELINKDENLGAEYINSWAELHNLYQSQQGLGRDAQIAQIEMEISKDYHRQRLQQLKLRAQYRSVEAQQEVLYSAALAKNEIAFKMRAIGINPQTLFDTTGKQFQRPQAIPNFIERRALWNKMTQYFDSPEQQILSLTAQGLGGVGKTSIAAHYCLHPPRPYELRAWLNAESRTQLSLDYIALAKEIGGMEFDEKEPIDKKVQLALKWLEGQTDCLLLYDNVPSAKEIDGLLPTQGRHHILITSRNSVDWPPQKSLDVDVMEESEAIDLIVNMTGHDKDKNIDALKELVKILGYLPLALVQAGAYIREHRIGIDGDGSYLDLYNEKKYNNQQELLEYTSEASDASKREAAWLTFNINFDALEKDCPLALTTLKQASWVAASNIPVALLFNMLQVEDESRDKRLWWNDINKQLARYSLMRVDVELHLMSIHPLLQDILRNKQTDKEKIEIFKNISAYLDDDFVNLKDENLDYKNFLNHVECLYQHGQMVSRLAAKQHDKDSEFLLIKPECLANIYLNLRLPQKALNYLMQKKQIYEKKYGPGYFEIATILGTFGDHYRQSGDFKGREDDHHDYDNESTTLTIFPGQPYTELRSAIKVLGGLGSAYMQLDDLNKAKQYLEKAVMIKDYYFGRRHFEAAGSLGRLGEVLLRLGEFNEAVEYLQRFIKIKLQFFGLYGMGGDIKAPLKSQTHYYDAELFETANAFHNLGDIYLRTGDLNSAESFLEKSLTIKETHFSNQPYEIFITLLVLGDVSLKLDKLVEAETYFKRSLIIQEKHIENEHFETTTTLYNLGTTCLRLGKLVEAEKHFEKVLSIKEEQHGQGYVETATTLYSLGITCLRLGKLVEAEKHFEKALSIKEEHHGQGHVETTPALDGLGITRLRLGKLVEARKYFEQVLRIEEKNHSSWHVETVPTLLDYLFIKSDKLGKLVEAERYFGRALMIKRKRYGEAHVETAAALEGLGIVCLRIWNLRGAENCFEQALRIKKEHYGQEEHIEIIDILNNLGIVYQKLGNLNEAKKYLELALNIANAHHGSDNFDTAIFYLKRLGLLCAQMKDLKLAKEYMERSLKVQKIEAGCDDVEVAVILYELAKICLKSREDALAKQYLEYAKSICASLAEGHQYLKMIENALSEIYFSNNDVVKYKKALEEFLKLFSENTNTYHNLGCCYNVEGNYEQANLNFEKSCSLSEYSSNCCEYGHFLVQQKKCGEAIVWLEKAIQLQEDSCLTYGLLEINVIDVALREVINQHENHEITIDAKLLARYLLIKSYYEQKNEEQMQWHMEEFKKRANNIENKSLIVHLYEHIKHYVNKKESLGLYQKGMRHYKAKEFTGAMSFFQAVLSHQQEYHIVLANKVAAASHFNLGAAYINLQKPAQALLHLQASFNMRVQLFGSNHEIVIKTKTRLEECNARLSSPLPVIFSALRAEAGSAESEPRANAPATNRPNLNFM